MRSLRREIVRAKRGRRAVGVAELGERLRDGLVQIPATAAEKSRLESDRAEPVRLLADEGRRIAAGRARVIGGRPVGVQAEGTPGLSLPGPTEPDGLVLSASRWPHQRRDREPAGPTLLKRCEALPHGIVERTLHMTRDDRVPPVQY